MRAVCVPRLPAADLIHPGAEYLSVRRPARRAGDTVIAGLTRSGRQRAAYPSGRKSRKRKRALPARCSRPVRRYGSSSCSQMRTCWTFPVTAA